MAKKFSPDYTADDIMELYRLRSDDGTEGRIRTLAKTFRALCRMEHEVKIPKQYEAITKAIRTPFVRDSWHRITSSLVAKPPIAHFTPKDDDRRDYRDAGNTAERWVMAAIERWNKEQGSDLVYDATAALVRDGESVIKVVHRPDAWANFPEGKNREEQDEWKRGVDLPITSRVVDRLSCVFEDGEFGDAWSLEYGEYTRPYLKSRYRLQETDSGRLINPAHSLEGKPLPEGLQTSSSGCNVKVEFFTDREWHVIVDGSPAPGWPKPNPYAPYLPQARAKAYDSESLLYSLMFLGPRLDEILTGKLNWAWLGAYPNPYIKTNPNPALMMPALGDAGDATALASQGPVKWQPGKMIELGPGQEIGYLAPPPVGKDLDELIGLLKSMIDIAGVPSIMRGVSGSGDSGYLANQLRAAAETAYKLAATAGQRQLEGLFERVLWITSNVVKQTVYVRGWEDINRKTGRPTRNASQAWLGLSPDTDGKNIANINKLGPIAFLYRPTLPTDRQANAMIALQLTNAQKPLYGRIDALETFMQEEDADSILDNIYVDEAIENDPTLKQMIVDNALAEAHMVPKPQPQPNPLGMPGQVGNLVGPNGAPLMSGPMSPGMSGVPMANQAMPGQPGVPGVTMPILPQRPQGGMPVGGNGGNGVAGVYPGQPGGPQR